MYVTKPLLFLFLPSFLLSLLSITSTHHLQKKKAGIAASVAAVVDVEVCHAWVAWQVRWVGECQRHQNLTGLLLCFRLLHPCQGLVYVVAVVAMVVVVWTLLMMSLCSYYCSPERGQRGHCRVLGGRSHHHCQKKQTQVPSVWGLVAAAQA